MNGWGLAGEGLAESGNDNYHEFNTVCDRSFLSEKKKKDEVGPRLTHPLATNDISQPTEQELSDQGATGGGVLDTEILIGGELTA